MKKLLLLSILFIVGCPPPTAPEPEDCAGVAGGTAVEDECGTCDSDTTNDCVPDCAGVWGGDAVVDECGICDGSGYADSCGVCDTDSENDNTPSTGTCDCEGIPNGSVVVDCAGVCGGTAVEDIDGNCYSTVQIGDQLWMAENLKVTHYNNEDEISYPSNADWVIFEEGQYGVYDNDPANADIYGNLYNWAVVDDGRGVCPEGWHVPSDDEWTVLTDFIAPEGIESWGNSIAGGKMKETGLDHWNSPNTGATNESGFTALPAGFRASYPSHYYAVGDWGSFWSSSESYSGVAWSRTLGYSSSNVSRDYLSKQYGFSIRCLKD